jgi:hypothetical protein
VIGWRPGRFCRNGSAQALGLLLVSAQNGMHLSAVAVRPGVMGAQYSQTSVFPAVPAPRAS